MPGGHIELVSLTKRFTEVAVDGIDLTIAGGEFFSLLGPSGCGKTTTLRLIAGLEQPTAGQILLDGADVSNVPAHKRNVNTVFQSYALFPFLSVFDNVAFGLRNHRLKKQEIADRVYQALDLVQLRAFEKRRPKQLSGGQQQRVALARALVLNPAVLLLDEPLGALDAQLRRSLKVELKALQERVGITFLYVTHDQEEALTMSDRLAVMRDGRIVQIGTPHEVYQEPADTYVADFLGVSNLMEVDVAERGPGQGCHVKLGEFDLAVEHAECRDDGPRARGHPPRASAHRAVRLRGPQPGGRDGGAAGVPRVGDPGHPAARARGAATGPRAERRRAWRAHAGNPRPRISRPGRAAPPWRVGGSGAGSAGAPARGQLNGSPAGEGRDCPADRGGPRGPPDPAGVRRAHGGTLRRLAGATRPGIPRHLELLTCSVM